MDQRTQFIADYLRETFSITELCEYYVISRKTGYQWIDRYLAFGPASLDEHSRRPRLCPRQTPEPVVEAILEARRRHPSWGAKKLLTIVSKRHPDWPWPHRSTIYDILHRHGLVATQQRRRTIGHPGKPNTRIDSPNQVWCADFKGQFKKCQCLLRRRTSAWKRSTMAFGMFTSACSSWAACMNGTCASKMPMDA